MPSGKDRLYVALYARGGAPTMPGLEDTYHWSFIVGPKTEGIHSRGSRFHAVEKIVENDQSGPKAAWAYEEREIGMEPTSMLLVRIMIAKVKSVRRLRSLFEGVPVRPDVVGWNCVGWIKEALEAALSDGKALGTSASDWESVRDTAMWYVETKKAAHRFDGKGHYDSKVAATWDMMQGVELTP
ncbi:hypothetical protein HIM_09590 [Hirsutella minnesotensis 3608]|uniref:Uncharacterized protein n=1 Tax=Hirsutella minnesotensis 3608 TaxID=1043627 RepID=A0A0F7ZGJ7_9HYPO|nr:hypothetical protein HIM_09590 [Hirsutella minnesotensis 3608]